MDRQSRRRQFPNHGLDVVAQQPVGQTTGGWRNHYQKVRRPHGIEQIGETESSPDFEGRCETLFDQALSDLLQILDRERGLRSVA